MHYSYLPYLVMHNGGIAPVNDEIEMETRRAAVDYWVGFLWPRLEESEQRVHG